MQETIVAIIVACATFAVLKRYAPKAVKQAVRSWASRSASRLGWSKLAARIERQAEVGASCADGCGSCGNCGPVTPGNASPNDAKQTVVSLENLRQNLRR